MQSFKKTYYSLVLERDFYKHRGNGFEDLFSSIMKAFYKEDFLPCKPWGNIGDRKNDGYIMSERTLFQVYAPNENTERKTIDKINTDFTVAIDYWEEFFDKWVFVHNSPEGLSPGTLREIFKLRDKYIGKIEIVVWGFDEVKDMSMQLEDEVIAELLGEAPTKQDFNNLGLEDIQPVLSSLSIHTQSFPPTDDDLTTVPHDKIFINGLSETVQEWIKMGLKKAFLVQELIRNWHDPNFGNEISTIFEEKYKVLRNKYPNDPDEVFYQLQIFTGGEKLSNPKRQLSVITVLAYLFENCTIFERTPREVENNASS